MVMIKFIFMKDVLCVYFSKKKAIQKQNGYLLIKNRCSYCRIGDHVKKMEIYFKMNVLILDKTSCLGNRQLF